jgi:hypothetical protein
MDIIGKSVEDELVCNLQYSLPAGASYVQERRSSTFFPAGGNQYGPKGTRVIRINLHSENGWLDCSDSKNYV